MWMTLREPVALHSVTILFAFMTALLFSGTGYAASQMCLNVKQTYDANIGMCNSLGNIPPGQMNPQQMGFARWCANQRGFLHICEKEATAPQYGNVYDSNNRLAWSYRRELGANGRPLYILSHLPLSDGVVVIVAEQSRPERVTVPYCNYPAYEFNYEKRIYYADNRQFVMERGTFYVSSDPNADDSHFKGLMMPYEINGQPLQYPYFERNCGNAGTFISFEKRGGTQGTRGGSGGSGGSGGGSDCPKGYNPYGCR